MKNNKYEYSKVIQQHFSASYGWEDVSEYETDSTGYLTEENRHSGKFITLKNGRQREISLLSHDFKEYQFTGYPTRIIFRKRIKKVTA